MINAITTTYAGGNLTRMAVYAAFGFVVLGVGLSALARRKHRAEGSKQAPRWLPIVVGVAAAAITISLWQAIVIDQRAQTKERVEARTALVRNEIALQIQFHILALDRMARRWHLNGMKDQQERKSDAAMIVGDYQGIEGIRWVDPSNHIGWTIPLRGHEAEQGVYLAFKERHSAALEAARNTGQTAVSRPVELTTGGQGFLVLVPLYDGDNFAGYIDGFFRIQHLLDTVLSAEVIDGYAIVVSEGSDEIYRRSESTNQQGSAWAVTKQLPLTGMDWRVKVWPEKQMMTELQSSIPTATLVFGLLISFVLAWTVWLAQAAHQRSKIMEATSLSLGREVAERTLAEQALAGALEKERALFENTLDVVCSFDAEGRFASINPACLRLWGYRQEELIGRRYIDMVVPEDIPKTNEVAARIIRGEATIDFVNRFMHKDGSHVDTIWSSSWSESQQLMFAVARDITERRRAETALQESEEKFRSVTQSANDAIMAADSDGIIISWNQGAAVIFGYAEEEILGQPLTLLMPDIYRVAQEKGSEPLTATVESHVIANTAELAGLRKDGEEFPLELSLATWSNGGERFYSGIVRDITARTQIAAELVAARDVAVESARLKAEFLANMSHEIRTPMNGVIGMSDLLQETDLSGPQRVYTENIQSSAEALLTIIDDILDFSKIEAGLMRFEKIDFELRGAVEAPVELLAERAHAKGLELASLVHRDVPTALRGDPGRLRQVLTNLIGNAVKFTDRGEVVVSVTKVGETASRAMLRFEIQDTGIGISAEAQRGLFRPFTQADGSTTRKYGGTGLGLAISKQLVELMGGEIGIESSADHGSTFWFTGRFEKQVTPAPIETDLPGDLSGARVLIVDDNATNRKILKHQTSSWGMIAGEAESGQGTLELLRAGVAQGQPYDIAVLDLMMPDMDGFQLAEAIKSDPTIASVALVLLPSFGKRGDGERARQVGIAAYLPKPVRQSQLHDCLTAVMVAAVTTVPELAPPLVTRHSLRQLEVQEKGEVFSSVRILVAEDNPTNQKVALGQLYNLGYRAEAVANGRELLKALENEPVDIILMDCQMPEMDGFAATAEIRRREGSARHTTIIAMTANALDGDDKKCLAVGMDDYLSKPVRADVLRLKLERWINPSALEMGVGEANDPAQHTRGCVIDHAHLASLRQIPMANFVTELIDLYLTEATSHLKTLQGAVVSDDVVEIQRVAHCLKGSSANMGATQMAVLSEELESNDRAGRARKLLPQLEDEFKLVREALNAERN